MLKNYNPNKNVFEAATERLNYIFDNFNKIYVSFSSGKDSGCLLNQAIDIARKRHRKIGALFIDLEAYCKVNQEFVERMFKNNEDVLEPMWVCLPMESPNSLSYLDPTWIWWDKAKEDIWVRPMPQNKWVINEDNHKFDFYKKNMPFEEFIKYFGDWYGQGEKVACLVGIRTDESLNRFRAIINKDKETYNNTLYSTRVSENTYNFYPIYDWKVDDIWRYNGKFGKDYNKIYDLFYKAGVSIYKMRVDEPFGNEAKAGLSLFRIIEPATWGRVVNRVSGANFGCIYDGKKIMNSHYTLPSNHTWKSFTKFLLTTIPQSTAQAYIYKFKKFMKYWHRIGCTMYPDDIEILERKYSKDIVNTHAFSNRGKGDKYVIKFKHMLDTIPEIDTKRDVPTWKRLAMAIIKNDFVCKSLGFAMTQDLTKRQQQLLKDYENI